MKVTTLAVTAVLGFCLIAMPLATAEAGTPAVRVGDGTTHAGGAVVTGSATVLIAGQQAARLGDTVVCPQVTVFVPHVGGPIVTGSTTVMINGQRAAVTNGVVAETGGIPSTLLGGASTVFVGD